MCIGNANESENRRYGLSKREDRSEGLGGGCDVVKFIEDEDALGVQTVQKSFDRISTLRLSATRSLSLGPVAEIFDHSFPQCINAFEGHAIDEDDFDVAAGDGG